MGKINPVRHDAEIGGMQWEVATPEELSEGHALRMTSADIINDDPDYPMADRTTITKLEDGAVHIALASERNTSYYSGNGEFPAGVLRAIVDYVEPTGTEVGQSSPTGSRNIFSRIMESLTSHASYLRR